MRSFSPTFAAAVLVGALAAAGGVAADGRSATASLAGDTPKLTDPHPCANQPGFTCSTLTVPLDHSGKVAGQLKLQVATADNATAPKGVLLFLTGGPGQPGVPFITRIATQRLPGLAQNYRFVMLDQRGTGELGAINCPKLQQQVGSSDIEAPTVDAINECATIIGPNRRFYTTHDTVADYEALRRALGVAKMTLDGVSYGTFTAARYALAHPARVNRLVLDSVVPHVDPERDDGLYLVGLQATGRVLRDACDAAPKCDFDPAKDVAAVVARRHDGATIFDRLVTYEFLDPTYRDPNPAGLPAGHGDPVGALHAAAHGDDARLNTLVADLDSGGDPVNQYSSGLHIATFCGDARFPWGDAAAPSHGRQAALDRRVARLPRRAVWPYERATVTGIGFVQECLHWPPEPVAPEPPAGSKLPPVPVLLLNGDRDLSTPLTWAREETARAPQGKLVIVKGAAHSIQNRERGDAGRTAVYAFLN